MTGSNRRRTLNLWKKNDRCYWCGRKTIIFKYKRHKKVPPNAATTDHLISRLNPLRGNVRGITVLACNKCNHERGVREMRLLHKTRRSDVR
jgi:hypothetical protein